MIPFFETSFHHFSTGSFCIARLPREAIGALRSSPTLPVLPPHFRALFSAFRPSSSSSARIPQAHSTRARNKLMPFEEKVFLFPPQGNSGRESKKAPLRRRGLLTKLGLCSTAKCARRQGRANSQSYFQGGST